MSWFDDGIKKHRDDQRRTQERTTREAENLFFQQQQQQHQRKQLIDAAKEEMALDVSILRQLARQIKPGPLYQRRITALTVTMFESDQVVEVGIKVTFSRSAIISFRGAPDVSIAFTLSVHHSIAPTSLGEKRFYFHDDQYLILWEPSLGREGFKKWEDLRSPITDYWHRMENAHSNRATRKYQYYLKQKLIKNREKFVMLTSMVFAIGLVMWILFVISGQVTNDDLVRWRGSEYYDWLANQPSNTIDSHLMGLAWLFMCGPPVALISVFVFILSVTEKLVERRMSEYA